MGPNILLVQLSFLGDTVLTTPLISAIKNSYPDCKLSVLTTKLSSELLRLDPLINNFLIYDKRDADRGAVGLIKKSRELTSLNYDIVFCVHRSIRTALLLYLSKIPIRVGFKKFPNKYLFTHIIERNPDEHEVLRNLSLLEGYGLTVSESDKELRIFSPETIDNSKLIDITKTQYVVFFPGSEWRTKQYNPLHFREVAEFCISKGFTVLLLGSKSEHAIGEIVSNGNTALNLTGRTTISELLFLVSKSKGVISNDSMGLHLASAFKIPSVSIFCATSPKFGFGPWRNNAAVVVEESGLSCKPCRRHGSNRCPTGTELCMNVSSSKVIDAVREVWGWENL